MKKKYDWHAMPIKKVLAEIHTSESGLTDTDVQKRISQYGYNELPKDDGDSMFTIFLAQYKNPMVLILVVAAIISGFVHEFVDMAVIVAALAMNTILGFIQEYKANKAISELRSLLKFRATVIRDGHQETIDPREVVPGDILILASGDRISADARIFWAKNFEVNEASLTGESMPITKSSGVIEIGTALADRVNMVHMGTTVTAGRAKAVVCQTGVKTHFGEVADLLRETRDEKTPLQEQLFAFSRFLGAMFLVLSLLIFLIGVVEQRDLLEMLLLSVAVAVAAVPEGLLVSLTVVLALGMQRILKKNALVRKLIAAETLGSVSVICSDKTGTLTEGEMRVGTIITASEVFGDEVLQKKNILDQYKSLGRVLRISALCNDAIVENLDTGYERWQVTGNPTDKAVMVASIEAGVKIKKLRDEHTLVDEIPFSSANKYMAKLFTYREDGGDSILYIKGAPEKILEWAGYQEQFGSTKILNKSGKQKLARQYQELTAKGMRVIAVGYKISSEKTISASSFDNLVFVAFIGLKDPLRPEAREAIALCKSAGIRSVIITGDHKLTARAIVSELGLSVTDDSIVEGVQLDLLSDSELKKLVPHITVFARVEPKHKVRIITAWQANNQTVAMIGDGINDAPALKAADIGVAVGSGTDVTKEIADMVLLDNNYITIVAAVEQGRMIFDNIRKNIVYLLADSFSEILLVVSSLLLGAPLPVTAVQILWINLITDGFPSLALTLEPAENDLMQLKPRPKDEPILNKEMKILIFIIGIFIDLVLISMFVYMWKSQYDLTYIRSVMFAALGIDSLLYVFSIKSLRHSLFHINPFSNVYLVFGVLLGIGLQLSALYIPFLQNMLRLIPLGYFEWSIVLGLALLKVLLIEITKFIFIIRDKKTVSYI